ncbi:MAG: lipopolysaccharide biosynthesis protein [Eubacteriales bacterium]|nr:lipopolysaccharide biosynthesis protein [Eubacteriales bacterium]
MVGFSMVTWISFALGFISSPIATRLFMPDELAKVNLFGIYAALFSSICYLGLDQAYVRFFREPPRAAKRQTLYTFCIGVPLAFSVLSSLALLFFWRSISTEIAGDADPGIFLCLCLYSFSLVMFRFLSLSYRMEQNAKLYTIQGVFQVLITKIAYLAVGFGNATGKAAILSLTVLMSLFSLVCLWFQRNRLEPRSLREADKPFKKELWAFALPLVPLSLLSWLNTNVNTVVLNQLMGFSETAIYSSALGLAASINIIQTGFNAYYAPYVLEHYQDDSTRFFTVHRLMACLLTLFGLLISLLQAPVFLLLGKAYRSSVVFFPFLFLSPICYCLGETTGMGITIAKKTHWTTLIFLFSAIINVVFCYLFIPWLGMAGAALASAATAILTLVLRTAVGERYYKILTSYRYLLYTIGLMLIASFGNLLLDESPVPKYLLLTAVTALACVLYRKEISTLLGTLKEMLTLRRKGPGEGSATE